MQRAVGLDLQSQALLILEQRTEEGGAGDEAAESNGGGKIGPLALADGIDQHGRLGGTGTQRAVLCHNSYQMISHNYFSNDLIDWSGRRLLRPFFDFFAN